MLKLPKGLKKKKKGKKSKRKGEDELFTEEELEKYRKEHQQEAASGEPSKENEEWSKFKNLTSGVDTVLKKTQGDLDRIKSTSFFQRVQPKEPEPEVKKEEQRPYVEITEADFPQLAQAAADAEDDDKSEFGVTDDESEEEEQDDIFDTSYVEAVERGEVKLAYVPDSPEDVQDDDIFDTSHVDALIKGQDSKTSKDKKSLDIGLAVGVLTGRIDNVTVTARKRPKRGIPGDLLLEDADTVQAAPVAVKPVEQSTEKSILDIDADIPISSPIDLSVSLHTSLAPNNKAESQENFSVVNDKEEQEEIDEFTLLAAESLEVSAGVIKLEEKEINLEPVIQDSWSAFEADKNETVFAECIAEDEIDVLDPCLGEDDPFDTSFADAVVPTTKINQIKKEAVILEDDDDFDPRAEEIPRLNNRRKSSVRIHLTDPSGVRESITSDDIVEKQESVQSRDLLGGSTTDLTQLGDSPLNPVEVNETEIDPFDTSIVDKIVAPGKSELKFLEQELCIGENTTPVYRVDSDPDFDPRAEESILERRASRPENLIVSKSVVFKVENTENLSLDNRLKSNNPVTPYYTRELSITEDLNEEAEASDTVPETLTRTRSDEDLAPKGQQQAKRRHSEYPSSGQVKLNLRTKDPFESEQNDIKVKVLTPSGPPPQISESPEESEDFDPFDTSFATVAPCKTELKLLAKEFSCEDTKDSEGPPDLLEPSDELFQVKALSPEPSHAKLPAVEEADPFDTSFAGDLNPGKTELKLLESEFLN